MKKVSALTSAALMILLVATGIWWMSRRTPGGPPPEETPNFFEVQQVGAGLLIQFQPGQTPIRRLTWTRPRPGSAVVAQVLTQTNRQVVVLFSNGRPMSTWTVTRPSICTETYFNFAELVDAVLTERSTLLLLYRDGSGKASTLLLALNLADGSQRWAHRGIADSLRVSSDGQRAFLFGAQSSVEIVDLFSGTRLAPAVLKVDLPPEVRTVSDLLPTEGTNFLVAHREGLSAWVANQWHHTPNTPASPLGFAEPRGALAGRSGTWWWQPEPGQLLRVNLDGSIQATEDLNRLVNAPWERDGALLRLLGSEPQGTLCFDLAIPAFLKPAAPSAGRDSGQGDRREEGSALAADSGRWVPDPPVPAEVPGLESSWKAYLDQGVDRVYRGGITGSGGLTQSFRWSAEWPRLGAPEGVTRPTDGRAIWVSTGGLLLEYHDQHWWLPATALPIYQPK